MKQEEFIKKEEELKDIEMKKLGKKSGHKEFG